MTKRVLLLIPEKLEFDMLKPEEQKAINSVFGQFVMPMPGTQPDSGFKVCDAITTDAFDPANMSKYDFDWPLLGMWEWHGGDNIKTLVPLDVAQFTARLAPEREYDEQGEIVSETPATLHEPHKWAGWPDVI